MVYLLVVFFIQAGIQFSSVLQFDSYFDSVLLWFIWGYFKFNIVMYLEEGQIVASMYDTNQSESDYQNKKCAELSSMHWFLIVRLQPIVRKVLVLCGLRVD